MTFGNLPVNCFAAALLLQAVATGANPDLTGVIGPIERLTLTGALVVAVRVLWVSNTKKDAQIIDMATKVTETMVSVMGAVKELRAATEELGHAMDNIAENVAAFHCSGGERS